MKMYLVDYETRDGEREYNDSFLLEAPSMKKAIKDARRALKEKVIGYGEWDDDVLDCFEVLHKIRGLEELPDKKEVEILSKRMFVVQAFKNHKERR